MPSLEMGIRKDVSAGSTSPWASKLWPGKGGRLGGVVGNGVDPGQRRRVANVRVRKGRTPNQ
jgi:hypothetical protein